MSLFFLRVSQGRYSGASDQPFECDDRDAAWTEMTSVCANLIGGVARSLAEDAEWRMELLDATRNPIRRIRLLAESAASP
jgi:hypothetical protein